MPASVGKMTHITINVFRLVSYHLRFIPEGVAEASQIFLQNAHVLAK
jgi:hypothetical protein